MSKENTGHWKISKKQEIIWFKKKNELMNKNCKKFCVTLSSIEHFLILISAVTGYVSISAFASWVSIAKGIMILQ